VTQEMFEAKQAWGFDVTRNRDLEKLKKNRPNFECVITCDFIRLFKIPNIVMPIGVARHEKMQMEEVHQC
jgi:hypothetical protein